MKSDEKILFVDDEPNILDGLRRQLRKKFDVETALGGEEGLETLREKGPFAVVVSDMKMPGMNGAQFLAKVREHEPDSVRMILSGQSELESAIEAINDGCVFRFLTKPCEAADLVRGLETAIDQHRLVTAERELLENTLSGAVKVMTEVMGLVNPEMFSRASRIQHYAQGLAEELRVADRWQIRLASMLSQIGCISLPIELLSKAYSDDTLSAEESEMFHSHPKLAEKLIASIPRLENVGRMIAGELEPVDPASQPDDPDQWDPILLGSQILRAAISFERLESGGLARSKAIEQLREASSQFPKWIVDKLSAVKHADAQTVAQSITADGLKMHMIVDEDLRTTAGALLVPKGEEVTHVMLARIRNFAQGQGIVEPFRVLVTV